MDHMNLDSRICSDTHLMLIDGHVFTRPPMVGECPPEIYIACHGPMTLLLHELRISLVALQVSMYEETSGQ